MARGAAFFDLDRTLLPGASGPVISEALRSAGVLGSRTVPGEGLLFGLFDRIGETRPSMMLARQGVRFSQGWRADVVRDAGREAATRLMPRIQPFALQLMAEHRAAGRAVVMATTTPHDLAAPLGTALGLDDVIATRYGEVDGRYDGTVDGHFVWGKGKLAAVEDWAAANDVGLDESYAYSDSYYDQPLLEAVANPVVVNPDPRMRFTARLRGWPTIHLDVPPGVPKLGGVEPQRALMALTRPELFAYAQFRISGTDHIPPSGPAIVVGNHRSYFDTVAMALALGKRGRPARFLGKKEVFEAPIIGNIARAMGGIVVDRGSGSDEPLKAAATALDAGEIVVLMPQGTIPRGRAFFDPVLKGRPGAVRLARMTGAPVIPVGLWGTEWVWPRNARFPAVWNVLDPPEVFVRVGEEVVGLERDAVSERHDIDTVMRAISRLVPEADRVTEPTPEQLARTFPPGHDHDPDAERSDTRS
ncbi:MAG: HAD-IB family hydrolase [Acidimicrobiia bacterium]|nr:HAD-IB family hydrolase [Acidimicrobiia bacterium]